jgi:hypothetical protein
LAHHSNPLTLLPYPEGNFVTTAVFVGINGKCFLTINGQFESAGGGGKCVLTSTGTYTVTGGTGAFLNATGTIATVTDVCAGTAPGHIRGHLPAEFALTTKTRAKAPKLLRRHFHVESRTPP